jgi:hypothetical protein
MKANSKNIRQIYAKSVQLDNKISKKKSKEQMDFFFINKNIKHKPELCLSMLKNQTRVPPKYQTLVPPEI